ncbi:acVLRF1 family peptidyl-tRNA hydrolase [Phytoactinopolyspora endophytica]|uniref:acVLRF1 family peptidyl-tRNA hydrolase n=1 Tax=Phytoactinopolyspora endophytica TaxID=1642495 RepID=UPI00197B3849|nr:acVLRF1 family peptidyl-tRNA hydrolase [Phytoactinopolyspora endophytica]
MPTKRITVQPERLERWLAGFADRHGPIEYQARPDTVAVQAADGAEALCEVPFGPLVVDDDAPFGGLPAHARRDRRVGVLLVRKGGYASGVFDGRELVASKVGSRHVQGRTAAGGQSQQRFARRREKQAREAFQAAADVAARVILPHAGTLDAVIGGGDRGAVSQVLADTRMAPLRELVMPQHLTVPDPKLNVLRQTPETFRAVQITLTEPDT